MAKSQKRIQWVQRWMHGGLGSIDERIEDLQTELAQLEEVRKALAKIEHVVNGKPHVARHPVKQGEVRQLVYEALTTTPMPVRDIAKKVGRVGERVYGPLKALEQAGKAKKEVKDGVQVWRRS